MQNLDSFRKDLIKKKHFLKWLKMTENAFLDHDFHFFKWLTGGVGMGKKNYICLNGLKRLKIHL